MSRPLEILIYTYAGFSAAHWGQLIQWLRSPPAFACGNVISDPYHFLIAVFGPIAAVCAIVIGSECAHRRKWPPRAMVALATFVIASIGLAIEARVLGEYGFPIGRIWWLP